MRRYLFFIAFGMIFLLIGGCGDIEKNYVPTESDIVHRNSGGLVNETRLKDFINNTETGQKDHIRVVNYTKEGDPILTDLKYNGEQLEVTNDSTRDEFGSGEISTFTCKNISFVGNKYTIMGCEGYKIPYHLAEGN
ncbi:DUF4362 domain-containing protein [Mesobacillus sp. AQ2]|uniref:DUF4362 domain-containing protein n=1 Tax=Mesobacillus sp. AQ2 TaxID=3043332 RepID=UPI0024C193B0|nr:DUF4362 domain-containing protein [Mesobacillus sp. AQ2]WHX42622.1 DUF4362 domain-containing protein [Mesobacillus sp. AQ2]